MTYETSENLRQLEDADWFAHVGEHDESSQRCIVLSSWQQALEHSESTEWQDLKLGVSNRFCEKLLASSPERFCQWNEIVIEMKQHTMPLVRRKVARVVQQHHLPEAFVDSVDWDVLGLCMESEYIDVLPAGFYSAGAYWYVHGHFPCGWKPQGTNGMSIIY